MVQAAQSSCVPIHGGAQELSRCGPGQPALGGPLRARGLDQKISRGF